MEEEEGGDEPVYFEEALNHQQVHAFFTQPTFSHFHLFHLAHFEEALNHQKVPSTYFALGSQHPR